jgi:hypothetical protein
VWLGGCCRGVARGRGERLLYRVGAVHGVPRGPANLVGHAAGRRARARVAESKRSAQAAGARLVNLSASHIPPPPGLVVGSLALLCAAVRAKEHDEIDHQFNISNRNEAGWSLVSCLGTTTGTSASLPGAATGCPTVQVQCIARNLAMAILVIEL